MNEWSEKIPNSLKLFLKEYGKVIFLFSFLVIIFVLFFFIVSFIFPSNLRVSFLDVGQGDAILIQTPSGKNMLIDGGPTNEILSQLGKELSYFDRTIDIMIATHPDADHITGLIPVLEKYKIKNIILSQSDAKTKIVEDFDLHVQEEGSSLYRARTEDVINFGDDVNALVLYSKNNNEEKKKDTNQFSIALLLMYRDVTFLLTGDLPSNEESHLLTKKLPKNIIIYKAGHHGSDTSSSDQLLSYIKPEYSIISAGKNNSYGHPNPKAIERLQKYSKEILSTIDRGAITFVTDGRMMEVKTDK